MGIHILEQLLGQSGLSCMGCSGDQNNHDVPHKFQVHLRLLYHTTRDFQFEIQSISGRKRQQLDGYLFAFLLLKSFSILRFQSEAMGAPARMQLTVSLTTS